MNNATPSPQAGVSSIPTLFVQVSKAHSKEYHVRVSFPYCFPVEQIAFFPQHDKREGDCWFRWFSEVLH